MPSSASRPRTKRGAATIGAKPCGARALMSDTVGTWVGIGVEAEAEVEWLEISLESSEFEGSLEDEDDEADDDAEAGMLGSQSAGISASRASTHERIK